MIATHQWSLCLPPAFGHADLTDELESRAGTSDEVWAGYLTGHKSGLNCPPSPRDTCPPDSKSAEPDHPSTALPCPIFLLPSQG